MHLQFRVHLQFRIIQIKQRVDELRQCIHMLLPDGSWVRLQLGLQLQHGLRKQLLLQFRLLLQHGLPMRMRPGPSLGIIPALGLGIATLFAKNATAENVIQLSTGVGCSVLYVAPPGQYGNKWDPAGAGSWQMGLWLHDRYPSNSMFPGFKVYFENWFSRSTKNTLGSSQVTGSFQGVGGGLDLTIGSWQYVRPYLGGGFVYMGANLQPATGYDYTPAGYIDLGVFSSYSHLFAEAKTQWIQPADLFTGQSDLYRFEIAVGFFLGRT